MAYISTETEEAIRVNGHHPMRAMFGNVRPVVCSFAETQIYSHGSRPNGSGLALSEVPRDGGAQRTRGDVPDDHDDHSDPFGIPDEPVNWPEGCDHEADKRWYLTGRSHMLLELINKGWGKCL